MGICIQKVHIRNFRSLKDVKIDFDEYTVLIGKNNSGKSNVVKALEFAFSYSNAAREDIFIAANEEFSFNKKILIDIKLLPIDDDYKSCEEFDDLWGRSLGDSISSEEESDNEFFAFRTEISYDVDKEIFTNNKYKIDKWSDEGEPFIGSLIKRDVLNGIDPISVPAHRDISLDIRDRSSIWGRLTSKIKVTPEVNRKIQNQLNKLNKEIVTKSDILKIISNELKNTTAERKSEVEISPITRDIESLYKGMDIYYTDSDSTPTSVGNLGLGVRSWAVFSTVKAEVLAKISKARTEEYAYHPFVLVEEPEAHVHPQAQRQLLSAIKDIKGQKIITTHSPYILSQIDLRKIRYVKRDSGYSEIVPLILNDLLPDDIRKIQRTVMNTRGEILYANAVILAEGETEEQALSVFMRKYFGKEPFELGINIIGVDGCNYLPFIRLLNRLNIKWYIFSDGESIPVKKLKDCIKGATDCQTEINLSDYKNVFVLEDNHNLETYLIDKGYSKEIINAINKVEIEDGREENYFDYFIKINNGQKGKPVNTGRKCVTCNQVLREGIPKDYKGKVGKLLALKDCITRNGAKTKYATAIAEEICNCKSKFRRLPPKIKELFDKVLEDLKKTKVGV